ncbi:MAG: TusE/DsrC/DsvC family sulfur relay protein [Acidimicrobiia bacterium]|jgi:tRNA 2-thiouridine synthesizing protein E
MPVTTIGGQEVHVDEEGFLTEYDEWNEDLAKELASNIGIDDLNDDHWQVISFLRSDYQEQGETATLRRVTAVGGIPTKSLFQLFPKKPARKMSYVSGLPKPAGCI